MFSDSLCIRLCHISAVAACRALVQRCLSTHSADASFRSSECITLRDGRVLSFCVYGERESSRVRHTLVWLHGTPGSRHEVFPDESILTQRGLQLLAIDRPGFGQSSFDASRTRLSVARDLGELLDQRGVRSVSLLGFSGGGAYALACLALPELRGVIRSVTLVASEGPYVEYPSRLLKHVRRDSPLLWVTGLLLLYAGPVGRWIMRVYWEHEQYAFFRNSRAFLASKYGSRLVAPVAPVDADTAAGRAQHAMSSMLQRLHQSVWRLRLCGRRPRTPRTSTARS